MENPNPDYYSREEGKCEPDIDIVREGRGGMLWRSGNAERWYQQMAKTSKEEQLIKRPLEKRISQFCSFPTEPKESEKMKIFQDDLKNVWTGENQVPYLNNSFNWNLNQGSCDPVSVVKETWSRQKQKVNLKYFPPSLKK